MKIAHYNTGNVSDPLGIIHNEQGEIILEPNEVILSVVEEKHCHIYAPRKNTWSSFWSNVVFVGAKTTIYRTNKRIVGIREPRISPHAGRTGIFGYLAPAIALWVREWKKKGRKECFSLPIEKIVGYKRGDTWKRGDVWVRLYVLSNSERHEKRYGVDISADKITVNQLLGDILKDKPALR